ncbi:hypothetical protein Q8A67_009921 [Cirrhinus molitorella]|uniref:TNFR-Cys domain-containing protein n=1 Tax=Cirrhinus molitorella TaxID=172907 RepID=A0AA88TYF7_9TELE|nr:hypothetical protein Q8A67_009921 [Cirrhinus molitorella]
MAKCNNAEYEINGECCPMCDPGNGLREKRACTPITNTVCEPLPGYYCIDLLSNCKKAMKHSTCSSGQYASQNGTEFSDTVCDYCPAGSYSDGTFCKLHTKCESLGKTTVKAGTETSDAECSNGLREKQACTPISNTVCEPLPGYYCIDLLSNCKKAMKHSTCLSGQYVNQNGTEFSDTVCDDCPAGSYSDGNRVHWHCTDDTSTTCVPCPSLTFTDEPNGLTECFSCTVCDANRGLRENKVCTQSSDTVCGPLERFYCIDKKKSSCTLALQHSECSPGQFIKHAGTGSTDTVCADCTGDTYSNGSFSSCLPHTKCEAMGLTETNPGTHSSDSKCGNPHTAVAIIATSETGNGVREKDSTKVVGGRKIGESFGTEEHVLTTCE